MSQVGRRHFTAALAASLALPQLALAKDTALPVPTSLPAAAGIAAAKNEPLVLLVSLPGCPYCELVRRNYLLPAQRDGSLYAWQLNISDRTTPLTGFDGKVTTAAAQVAAWKAGFTPTVLFLGPAGQDLAERLVGLASVDFYGAYLEERLAQARRAVVALR
jgi:thioredoxin-related protein